MTREMRVLPMLLATVFCFCLGATFSATAKTSSQGKQQAAKPSKQQNRNSVLPANTRP
ncbi:hypothetical protein AB4Z48_37320 [Cupriavidus sp. 2TAF22]|uniref:hypothetical protein n=1 Tax=unclassified Cupriavidus TaxID=2640874 RepID=UPI003F8FCDBE